LSTLRQFVKRVPLAQSIYRMYARRAFRDQPFPGSGKYWEERYRSGGNSGTGSYNRLALFKAEVINNFILKHGVQTAIEFGCGDGNQLSLLQIPCYTGLDVSSTVLQSCAERFRVDRSKSFFLYDSRSFIDNRRVFSAELALSLDVIYHLIEDDAYENYMHHLFGSAERFVVVYSSNKSETAPAPHVRHRRFTDWVATAAPDWKLSEATSNRYPFDPQHPDDTSFADFYFFTKSSL
jgi:hypothetical protein